MEAFIPFETPEVQTSGLCLPLLLHNLLEFSILLLPVLCSQLPE